MNEENKKPGTDAEVPLEEQKPTEEGTDTAPEEKPAEEPQAAAEEKPAETEKVEETLPEQSELDRLKEENFRLRTQLEANAAGFMPEVVEDAVILAEAIVKRDGSDISAALKTVAKKYPGWTAAGNENAKGGFKLGADSSKGKQENNDDKLNKIFGIRKK